MSTKRMSTTSSSSNIFPYDILVGIAKQVGSYIDFIAFAGVCKSWRSAAIESNRFNGSMLPHFSSWPWLMLAQNHDDDNGGRREFYSLAKKMVFKVELPEANDDRYYASNGWLITIARDLSIHLLHPFSLIQIKLPNLNSTLHYHDPPHELSDSDSDDVDDVDDDDDDDEDEDDDDDHDVDENVNFYFVHEVVLSSSTSSNSGTVMVIYGDYAVLAFCRLGEDAAEWTKIKFRPARYMDLIHYKEGQFYALDCRGRIVFVDVAGPNPTMGEIVATIPKEFYRRYADKLYLVGTSSSSSSKMEMAGKLLVVRRIIKPEFMFRRIAEFVFHVFEVDLGLGTWREVKNLGDIALFLGHNSCFYLESNSNNGIKPNSIYFAEDDQDLYYLCIGESKPDSICFAHDDQDLYYLCIRGGGENMGIYNLQDGSI